GADVGTLQRTLTVSTNVKETSRAMCDPLYIRGGLLERVPVLAAGPPVVSPDKRTYTVQLRQGIEFNDGTPLNAQAVVASVQRFETFPGSMLANGYALVDSVTTAGQYTVV